MNEADLDKARALLSGYNGATLFVFNDDSEQVDDYNWDGPIPRVDEVIYIRHLALGTENSTSKKLRVEKVCWSTMCKENPRLRGQLFIHCEIHVVEEPID